MSRQSKKVPSYRLHKASGQAVVTLNGTDVYLGRHGSESSRTQYGKVVSQWLSHHKLPPASSTTGGRPSASLIDLHQLFIAYYDFARSYYIRDGKPTGEVESVRYASRPLIEMFGFMLVCEFRPSDLKAVRQRMVDDGLSRKTVNNRINRIRRIFKWGVENDLVPTDVFQLPVPNPSSC